MLHPIVVFNTQYSEQCLLMSTYDFHRQSEIGQHGEKELDALLKKWYAIDFATEKEQRGGIDR